MPIEWKNTTKFTEIRYKCGYCGLEVGPDIGYSASNSDKVLICPNCIKPSYWDSKLNTITPGTKYGEKVKSIPDNNVEELYEESRRCMMECCYTAVVLCCRKLLMNISVSFGADKNKAFSYYVDFLDSNHYINPLAKPWVDIIRKKGNEATHEIPSISEDDAQKIIKFSEMLLKTIYEYPSLGKEIENKT